MLILGYIYVSQPVNQFGGFTFGTHVRSIGSDLDLAAISSIYIVLDGKHNPELL